MADDDARSDRRRFLAALAAAGLAGCTESRDPTPTGGSTPPSTTTPEATQTGKGSPTDTESPSPEATPEPRPIDGTWSSFGYDLGNSGTNGKTRPLTGHDQQWALKVKGSNTLPEPVVTDDSIHVTTDSYLYGIDRTDGVLRWHIGLDLPAYFFTPAVGDDVLYATARRAKGVFDGSDAPGALLAVDPATGDVRWRREAFVSASPVVHDGLLYFPASTADLGSIEAISVGGGDAGGWSYQFGEGADSAAFGTPALADGRLFATGTVGADEPTGRLVALDSTTGDRQWRVTTPATTESAPAYSDGDVFFGDEAGTLFSVDAQTGTTNWTHQLDERIVNKPSVGNGRVYVLSDSRLHAFDRSDGTHQWSTATDPTEENVTVTSEHVYVGGISLEGFDAATGEKTWDRPVPGWTGGFGVPVVVDGFLYVGVCIKEDSDSLYDNYVKMFG